MSEEKKKMISSDLQMRLCNHIARGDKKVLENIKTYHMAEITKLSDYMMDFVNYWFGNVRALNQTFYMAVSELGINITDMYNIPSDEKIVSHGLSL